MKIRSISIENFRSFNKREEIIFGDGFNIIVGQNNSGKSTIIECLKLNPGINSPFSDGSKNKIELAKTYSRIDCVASITRSEMNEIVFKYGTFSIPYNKEDPTDQFNVFKEIVLNNLHFEFGFYSVGGNGNFFPISFDGKKITSASLSFVFNWSAELSSFSGFSSGGGSSVEQLISGDIVPSLHFLDAQRYNISRCGLNETGLLQRTGSNLPAVLNNLSQSYPQLFSQFKENFFKIFPNFVDLTTPPFIGGGGQVEIWLWGNDKIAFPLEVCGTGVGQVLAILYLAMSEESRVIVIDEINAFLHPSAIKSLINILKNAYSKHQYIISTHSTDVISWSEPDKVILVTKEGLESKIKQINTKEIDELREVATELGISLADVFGSDRIIWVEGETEEKAFPLILESMGLKLGKGLAISKVVNTGDFSQKNSKYKDLVYEVYNKISTYASPLSKQCHFIFDKEKLTDSQVNDLRRKSNGVVRILPRRCYENYLLNIDAIRTLLNEEGENINSEEIAEWLHINGGSREFDAQANWNGDIADIEWITKVDAAKLLSALFSRLTENRVNYKKTRHSVELTRIIIKNHPEQFGPLKDFLGKRYNEAMAD